MEGEDENSASDNNLDTKNDHSQKEELGQEQNSDIKDDETIGKSTSSVDVKSKKIDRTNIAGRDINIKNINIDKSEKPNGLPKKVNDLGIIKYNVTDETAQLEKVLLKDRFIVVNCASNDVAISIAYSIANLDIFHSYHKYECLFDRYEKSALLVNLLEDSRKHIFEADEHRLLFIYDSQNVETPKLLESLRRENDIGKKDILDELHNDTYVIYFSYHENTNYLKSTYFEFHYINAFKIYAKNRSFSQERIMILRQQQEDNLWGSDKDLLIDLDKYNENQLSEIIQAKQNKEKTDFRLIISNKKQPVARYALFVATFFPKSSPGIFREYVEILLQEKEIIIDEHKVSLLTIWNDEVDTILYECRLETYKSNKQYLIDFPTSTEAVQCEEMLYSRFTSFIDQQARILIDKQELFTNNTSKSSHFQLYPIIAKLAISFRDYYGSKLLENWVLALEKQRKEKEELEEELNRLKFKKKLIDSEIDPEHFALQSQIEKLETDKNRLSQKLNKNIYLFVHLLNTIHEKDIHKEIVLDFFSNCFRTIYQYYVILDILNGFQTKNPQYNLFQHYKYALEHPEKKINTHAFNTFCNLILAQPSMFYVYIKRIENWFPSTKILYENYTKLQKYIILVWHICFTSLREWDFKNINKDSFQKSDTFLTLFNDVEKFKTHADFITYNLFTPETHKALHELFFSTITYEELIGKIENDVEKDRSQLIEYWSQLLKFRQNSNTSISQEDKSLQVLIDSLNRQLDKLQKKNLIKGLGEIRNFYNLQISRTKRNINILDTRSNDYTLKKEQIKTKRNYLADFIKLLKNNHEKSI